MGDGVALAAEQAASRHPAHVVGPREGCHRLAGEAVDFLASLIAEAQEQKFLQERREARHPARVVQIGAARGCDAGVDPHQMVGPERVDDALVMEHAHLAHDHRVVEFQVGLWALRQPGGPRPPLGIATDLLHAIVERKLGAEALDAAKEDARVVARAMLPDKGLVERFDVDAHRRRDLEQPGEVFEVLLERADEPGAEALRCAASQIEEASNQRHVLHKPVAGHPEKIIVRSIDARPVRICSKSRPGSPFSCSTKRSNRSGHRSIICVKIDSSLCSRRSLNECSSN